MGWKSLAAGLAILFGSGAAHAVDVLELKDGRVLFGWVLEQSDKEVKFESEIANVKSVMTVKRKDIVRLELDPVRPGELDEAEDVPADDLAEDALDGAPVDGPPGATAVAPRKRYVLVPIEGTIGEQVFADGVKEALRAAVGAGVEDVVFDIRSGGGSVAEVQAIAAAMKEFDEQLYYHSIVSEAFSACVWILAASDTILVRSQAATGGAVAYSINMDTGAAEVDAKMLSILASEVAALAESKGRPGAVFRSMIIPDVELWTWRDAYGRIQVSNSPPPAGVEGALRLDDKTTVLSMTGAEAVSIGFAIDLGEGQNVGSVLEGQEWALLSDVGERSMKRAALRRERAVDVGRNLVDELNKQVADAVAALDAAQRADPASAQSYFVDKTGRLTPQSQADWRNNCRKAIAAWTKAQSELRKLDRLAQRFFQLTGERLKLELEIDAAIKKADDEIRRLKAMQSRDRL